MICEKCDDFGRIHIENLLRKWNDKRGKKKNLWFGRVLGISGVFDGFKFDFELQWNLLDG